MGRMKTPVGIALMERQCDIAETERSSYVAAVAMLDAYLAGESLEPTAAELASWSDAIYSYARIR